MHKSNSKVCHSHPEKEGIEEALVNHFYCMFPFRINYTKCAKFAIALLIMT